MLTCVLCKNWIFGSYYTNHWGQGRFQGGIRKGDIAQLRQFLKTDAEIVATLALLYERPDLRIRVEATLSELLNRQIRLDVIDGMVKPKVRFGKRGQYDLFQDECHGVLELVALLSHVYDDEVDLLLIDEPELNLHPQYQAFVLSEIQKQKAKRFVLATHSPSFLDIRSIDDLSGVICFHADYKPPSRYHRSTATDSEIGGLLSRMTEHHRSFFFATKPVFTEGPTDAALISGLQSNQGRSAAAAGSSIIYTSGKDDAARYLMLCMALGKDAVFVFDLDALFDQRLSAGVGQNQELVSRIAQAGHGDFTRLRGGLERDINAVITKLKGLSNPGESLRELHTILSSQGTAQKDFWLAALIECHRNAGALDEAGLKSERERVSGSFEALRNLLAGAGYHLLRGGALENHLPSYAGYPYRIPPDAKQPAVAEELKWLATHRSEDDVRNRYGDLWTVVTSLPSKPFVDIIPTLRRELADVLHAMSVAIRAKEITTKDDVASVLGDTWSRVSNFAELETLIVEEGSFNGKIAVKDRFGVGALICTFDNKTQTNDPNGLDLEEIKD